MENDEVKECWHQNVTQCHDTYITGYFYSSIKGIEFLSQTLIFLSLYLCILMSETLDILDQIMLV